MENIKENYNLTKYIKKELTFADRRTGNLT